jgi:hypothetical protein
VLRVRKLLTKRKIGLSGPREIQAVLRGENVLSQVPSTATIERILRVSGWTHTTAPTRTAYFPQPTARDNYVLHLMDWTLRYLKGGIKVYAFHSLDLQTRALQQTISTNKSGQTVCQHVLQTWQKIGLPHGLQMDNDAAFCGGYRVKRVFSTLVRLCLFVGVEPIFIPVREPQRNGVIEQVNGLWSQTFWRRFEFRTVTHIKRAKPQFEAWYWRHYHPLSLHGQTVTEACRQVQRLRLTKLQVATLPDDKALPITAGRVHFIRLVDEQGDIKVLNERWHVHKRLAGEYVWAVIVTHEHALRIYHRRSAAAPVRLVKTHRYALPESVVSLLPCFQRPQRRRRICTML